VGSRHLICLIIFYRRRRRRRHQGVPTKQHRVQKELERVKGYMTRLQVIKAPGGASSPAAAAAAAKPALKVDTAASQRMVVRDLDWTE